MSAIRAVKALDGFQASLRFLIILAGSSEFYALRVQG